jgi:hypothetical protein
MMTPKQFRAEIVAFAKAVGPRADITAYVGIGRLDDGETIGASLYPRGYEIGKSPLCVRGDDFDTLLANLRAAWADYEARHTAEVIRKMALEIIRITADRGECSDAALRAEKFSDEEVKKYGELACVEANKIAVNGPFEIAYRRGANAA